MSRGADTGAAVKDHGSERPTAASRNHAEWQRRENWTLGLYFSRVDTRFMVPKRLDPRDLTPNLGHPRATVALAGLVSLPLLLTLFAFVFQLLR